MQLSPPPCVRVPQRSRGKSKRYSASWSSPQWGSALTAHPQFLIGLLRCIEFAETYARAPGDCGIRERSPPRTCMDNTTIRHWSAIYPRLCAGGGIVRLWWHAWHTSRRPTETGVSTQVDWCLLAQYYYMPLSAELRAKCPWRPGGPLRSADKLMPIGIRPGP